MNSFELMFLLTPIFGAIGGGTAGKEHGLLMCIAGAILGLILGVGLCYASICLVSFLCGSLKIDKSEKLNVIQWIVSFTSAVLIPMINPFAAYFLTSNIVKLVGSFSSG